mgnify:FL=1
MKVQIDTAPEQPQEHAPQLTTEPGRKVYIKSYGCQMNVYDAERMQDLLGPYGFESVETPEDADLIILNTCHIREKADEKVFSDVGRMVKGSHKKPLVAVGGCMGQAMGREVMRRSPSVNIVFGPQTYHRLPEFVARAGLAEGKRNRVLDTDFPALEKFDALPPQGLKGYSAFVTIQEGCDKFCTYCVVPYTRGVELSRPMASVVDEVKYLADQGAREVCLLGQNVNAYHGLDKSGRESNLAGLIREVAKVSGIERIRFTTSHPSEMDNELIQLYGEEQKLMPYLHLPVQSGSDRILVEMNRTHTAEDYLQIIDLLRMARPDIAISGDFITGFPGETDAEFDMTMELVREVEYMSAYSFMYSPRPNTPAAEMPDQVPHEVKRERLHRLQALLNEQQLRFNQKFVGSTIPVLLEEKGRKPGQLRGRSPHNVAVNIQGNERLLGGQIRVNITQASGNSLRGEAVLTDA